MLESAKWIENPGCPAECTPVFRKKFQLADCKKVEIAICGLGFYVLTVNGKRVSDELLTPPFTAYDRTVLYQIYDISSHVTAGENVIEVTCGNGWFNQQESDGWDFNHTTWKAAPKMICQVDVDGECYLVSDRSWESAEGKTIFNSHRGGETYDSRKTVENFTPVRIARGPGGILKEQKMPAVKLQGVYEGKEIYPYVYDFGQTITGNVEVTAIGNPGDPVDIFYSERLRDDFTVDRENITAHVYSDRFARDLYLQTGDGEETWHGEFSFHGFRYVRLYYPKSTKIISIKARDMHTDLKEIGGYTCDVPVYNQLHDACVRSLLTNYMHIPMDCPHREKNGWTADAMLSSFQALYNLDMKDAYVKWLDDIVDCQRPNGAIPCIAPTSTWGYQWGSGTTWDAVLFVLPWNIYRFTGDVSVLERFYPAMEKYIGFLKTQSDDNIYTNGLGDWCTQDGVPECEEAVLVTCYAKHIFDVFAQISEILGASAQKEDAVSNSLAIRKAFQVRFEGKTTVCQTYYAAIVSFDMTDDKQKAADELANLVTAAGGHIEGGIFGALLIPDVLRDYGYFELAWKMISTEEYPGWIYMMRKCHGAMGESWIGNSSLDHHMFSTVEGFMHASLSGLRMDLSNPGMTKLHLRPYFPDDIGQFAAWYELYGGRLEIAWDKESYSVTLPEGIEATVELDGKEISLKTGENTLKYY